MSKGAKQATLPVIRSDILPSLRQLVETIDLLKKAIGPIAEFRLVIDANILIADVLWMVQKRRDIKAKTDLQECLIAGTIIGFVTPQVIDEVEEHLPVMAAQRGLEDNAWVSEWTVYKAMLKIADPSAEIVARYITGQDPDDAPTLALADALLACGILTRDTDIAAMGGRVVPVEFTLQARDYSRKAAVNISIKIGGYFAVVGTVEALRMMSHVARKAAALFQRLPTNAKILAFMVVISIVLYPRSRHSIAAWLKQNSGVIADALPQVGLIILRLAEIAGDDPDLPQLSPETVDT